LLGEGVDEHEQIAAVKKAEKAMLRNSNFPEVMMAGQLFERVGRKLPNVLYSLEYFHDFRAFPAEPLGLYDIFRDRAPSGSGLK
jgi:hypothetical protein